MIKTTNQEIALALTGPTPLAQRQGPVSQSGLEKENSAGQKVAHSALINMGMPEEAKSSRQVVYGPRSTLKHLDKQPMTPIHVIAAMVRASTALASGLAQ